MLKQRDGVDLSLHKELLFAIIISFQVLKSVFHVQSKEKKYYQEIKRNGGCNKQQSR